jgi:hypothetical protein
MLALLLLEHLFGLEQALGQQLLDLPATLLRHLDESQSFHGWRLAIQRLNLAQHQLLAL